MNEQNFTELLQELIYENCDEIRNVHTFDVCGLLTNNNGLVVRLEDGTEFQMTIVKSR